jgi:hypothetical protein
MFMTAELAKRIEYGVTEGKRMAQTLEEATRMADNVTSVVTEAAAAGVPLAHELGGAAGVCKAQIKGARMSSAVLYGALASFAPDAEPIIPVPVSNSDMRFGIDRDLSRAVKAVKAAQRTISADSFGDQRDHAARAVSRALTILEGLLRQTRGEQSVT